MSDWLETISGITNEEMQRDETGLSVPDRVAIIRTSDRISFKRCRRRWGWQSHLRHNLGTKTTAAPLWFGSGVHFALEDFHGYRKFGSSVQLGSAQRMLGDSKPQAVSDPNAVVTTEPYRAATAFIHYARATYTQNKDRLPDEWREITPMAVAMLDYYQYNWLHYRSPLRTLIHDGIPQVEVGFRIRVPFEDTELLNAWGYDRVEYSGTLDRIVEDEHGGLWILEYKTAKSLYQLHYQVDPQIGAYIWAARNIYPDRHIMGVIYQQHLKDFPEGPRILANGGVSVSKTMRTSYSLYHDTLTKVYGASSNFPPDNVFYLNSLAKSENMEDLYARDCFIRRDAIERNEFSADSEGEKIMMEVMEMLDPNLPLYPNPTRDCPHLCPFLSACVSLDDGSDWKYILDQDFIPREAVYDSWRQYLPGGPKWVQL